MAEGLLKKYGSNIMIASQRLGLGGLPCAPRKKPLGSELSQFGIYCLERLQKPIEFTK